MLVAEITQINATVFNGFFFYIATKWWYRAVVRGFVFGACRSCTALTQLLETEQKAAAPTHSVHFRGKPVSKSRQGLNAPPFTP